LNVKKSLSTSSLPFTAQLLIDGEVYIEWFRPDAASPSQHVIGWRPIVRLFGLTEEARTRQIDGLVTNGRSDVTDKAYVKEKLKRKDCDTTHPVLQLKDDVE
jgi:hypothetical protein